MSKEIPYFKFYIGEWFNGDITLEAYDLQGVFINICAYYWSKDCQLSLVNLKKKFRDIHIEIDTLIESNIIKVIHEDVSISFLDEQLASKEVQTIANRVNGAKGGRPVKTENKANGLNFVNPNDNPNVTNIKESKVNKNINTPAEAVDFDAFMVKFNAHANRKFKITEKIKRSLMLRLKDYDKIQILKAIKNAHLDSYHIETNFKYLTPEFILREDKLEKFLNAPEKEINMSIRHSYLPAN